MKQVFFYSLIFLICNVGVGQVHAQHAAFSLSPSVTEIAIKPGQTAQQHFKLENNGDPTLVRLEVVSFAVKDSSGGIILNKQANGPFEFKINDSSIVLEETFFLKNNDSREFDLTITGTEGALEQDYYYTLLAQSDAPKAEEETVSARARITLGSHLLITVSLDSKVEIKPKIALFEVLPRFSIKLKDRQINLFDSFDKIPVKLSIDNKGKNLIVPRGTVTIKGMLGKTKSFEIKSQNVLAYSQKELYIEATPLSGFFLGTYQVSASLNFGQGTPTLFSSNSFIAVPFKFIIALAILVPTILIAIYKLKID